MNAHSRPLLAIGVTLASLLVIAGCPGGSLSSLNSLIDSVVNSIQSGGFPDDFNRPITLDPNVAPIGDVDVIPSDQLGRTTLVGFENLTPYDLYIQFLVGSRQQDVFVAVNETLLLDYGCIRAITLLSEQDFNPRSGRLVQEFDLGGAQFVNPDDFLCGEAFIISIDESSIVGTPERIDLVR